MTVVSRRYTAASISTTIFPVVDLLTLGDIDRRNRARDARGVHMLHLHRFQRHDRLTGRDRARPA